MYDVIVVGGGVVGCGIARELSRFRLRTVVLEQFNDVSAGTSKANSGIVHAGFDAKPNTLKAKFNILGTPLFDRLSRELDFPFRKNGALVLCFSEKDRVRLTELLDRGRVNGVKNLELLSGDEVRKIEPHVSEKVVAALYARDSGIVSPYEMNIAYAENALVNGVAFEFGTRVAAIEKGSGVFSVVTSDGEVFEGKVVINCAGVFADEVNNMVCERKLNITARRGEYSLLDKECGLLTDTTLFQLPTDMGKGILVAPTTSGNILVGPTAHDNRDKWNVDTTEEGQRELFLKGSLSVPELDEKFVIKQYCGLRAHNDEGDFVIGWSGTENFYNVAGIESPGLSAAPAIAIFVADEVAQKLNAEKNEKFCGERKGIVRFASLGEREKAELVKNNPHYAKILCHCEGVTEAEIIDSIRRPLGAVDQFGVKRRTRAGMGRCQSDRCLRPVCELLSQHLNVPVEDFDYVNMFKRRTVRPD